MLWVDDKLCEKEKDNKMPKRYSVDGILAENDTIARKTLSHA